MSLGSERRKVKDFERFRNLANGQDPNEGMSEIDMVIKELEEEERENKNQPEPENWTSPQKLLKEKLPIYSKRMLFTYKNCGCCKKDMTNLKVLLNNIFPAGICDEICNYNLHCSKCKDLNDKERRYINFNYHFDYFKDKELTRVEKHIYFFKTRMEKSPIYLSNTNRTNTRQMKREIDVLMGTFKLKQEFKHNKLFLMAIKSFVKREWKTTYHFLKNFHDLTYMKYCKNKREWWFPQNDWTYTFRNREFQVKDILEIFLREYLEELFKGYEKYCNLTEIEEHLQKVINT